MLRTLSLRLGHFTGHWCRKFHQLTQQPSTLHSPRLPRVFQGGLKLPASISTAALLPAASGAEAAAAVRMLDFKEMGLLGWLIADVALNVFGFGLSSWLKTEKLYDLFGASTFFMTAMGSFLLGGASGSRKIALTVITGAWAVRLGSFLFMRVMKVGGDRRFDEIKNQPGMFFVMWAMQGVWAWVSLLPVLVVNGMRAPTPFGTALDILGITLFALGAFFEWTSDWQKWQFKQDPANNGKFISSGLWSWSRHPNYFGELVIWWGVFLTSVSAFTSPWHYATIASPLFVYLVINHMTGVPILEKQADDKWGKDAAYQAYKARVPMLVPLPPFLQKQNVAVADETSAATKADEKLTEPLNKAKQADHSDQ